MYVTIFKIMHWKQRVEIELVLTLINNEFDEMTNRSGDRTNGIRPPSHFLLPSCTAAPHWSLFHFLISSHHCRGAASLTYLSAAQICVILFLPASLHLFLLCLSSPPHPPVLQVNQIHRNSQKQEKANLLDKKTKESHIFSLYSVFNHTIFFSSYLTLTKMYNVIAIYLTPLLCTPSEGYQMHRSPGGKISGLGHIVMSNCWLGKHFKTADSCEVICLFVYF